MPQQPAQSMKSKPEKPETDPVLSPGLDKDKLNELAASLPVKEPVNSPVEPVKPEPVDQSGVEAIKEMLPAGWAHKIGCGLLRGILLKLGKEALSIDEARDLERDHDKFEIWILAKLPAWLQKIAADNGPGINLLAAYAMLILFKPSVLPVKTVNVPVVNVPVSPDPVKPVPAADTVAPIVPVDPTAAPGVVV